MWHVYRTLVSDVTNDYSSNVANKFKVKLDLKLPGQGWKVSIVSAIVSRMALFKDLQNESKNLVEVWYNVEGVTSFKQRNRKKGYFAPADLRALEKDYKCTTGVEWMNEVKALLDWRRHDSIPSGKKILDTQWVKLDWTRDQSELKLAYKTSEAVYV